MSGRRTLAAVSHYWHNHYSPRLLCGLCGQSGVLDTRGRAVSPRGVDVGELFWCICPDGQKLRTEQGGPGPTSEQAILLQTPGVLD